MIGDYRWRVPGSEDPNFWRNVITANGIINLDVYLETQIDEEEPPTWELLKNGHRTVSIAGQVINQIADGPGTLPEKRALVFIEIDQAVLAFGLIQSDQAARAFVSLLPNGAWPSNDITRTIEF